MLENLKNTRFKLYNKSLVHGKGVPKMAIVTIFMMSRHFFCETRCDVVKAIDNILIYRIHMGYRDFFKLDTCRTVNTERISKLTV